MNPDILRALERIDQYCDLCGCLILRDKTPIEFTNYDDYFNERFEKDEIEKNICWCCEENKSRPFLWIGQLPGYYIAPAGKIFKAKSGLELKPFIDNYGYPAIKIYLKQKEHNKKYPHVRKNLRIHKINMLAHKPLYEYKDLVIRHHDDNKLNPHIENLIWGTQLENMADKKRNKKRKIV